ncbi:MAG: LLM class flavin-dependent oxidoreductase [Gammaproteobacteria bacterium]|nr:LLM class flavin-dependent oxidoreductase [Gammaproteobacteria bacterium]
MSTNAFKFGLMIRAQYPRDDDMVKRFEEVLSVVRLAERLGFDCITKGMHYGASLLGDYQQIPFLARIMAEAPSMRLNAGVVLLSLHKPLDIAEQFATLDVMSGGKVILGVALGYRDLEFKAFGTSRGERVARLEENLLAIKRLWTEERVTMTASHFELDDVSLGMRPVQKPHPPIWMGANADVAIRRAARLADCWYIPPHNRVDSVLRQLDVYRRELDACGREFPEELPMRREVFVANDRREALRLCGAALQHKYRAYVQWGQNDPMPAGDDLDVELEELLTDRFLIGSPDEVAEGILRIVRPTGVNHLIISTHWPGMETRVAMDAMQRFAEEVMPRVRSGL